MEEIGLSEAIAACISRLPKGWMDRLSFGELNSISDPAPQEVIISAIRMMHRWIKEQQATAGNMDLREYWMTLYLKIGSGSDDPDLGEIVKEVRMTVEAGFSGSFEDWKFVGQHCNGSPFTDYSLRLMAIEEMLKLAKTWQDCWEVFNNAYWAEDTCYKQSKNKQGELKKRHQDIRVGALNHCYELASTSEQWFRVYHEYDPDQDCRERYLDNREKSEHALVEMTKAIYREIEEGKLNINEFAWPLVVKRAGNFRERKECYDWFVKNLLLKQVGGATTGGWLKLIDHHDHYIPTHRGIFTEEESENIRGGFRHNAVSAATGADDYYRLFSHPEWPESELEHFSDKDLAVILNYLFEHPNRSFKDLQFIQRCWEYLSNNRSRKGCCKLLVFNDQKLLKEMGKMVKW